MIEDFINSALIIDDKESDIIELQKLLEEKDIWVKHLLPKDLLNISSPYKNRKIIFLDLYLSNTATELKGHISEIRKILKNIIGKNFGTYGIVMWSAHVEEIDLLKEKIQLDGDKYVLPAFVIGLSKKKYLTDANYSTLLKDLDEELNKNTAASFFIQWDTLVQKGKDLTINNIYSLSKDYKTQEQDLKFILLKLAQNYTGIPTSKIGDHNLESDAIKAFSDLLHYDIINQKINGLEIFKNPELITYSSPQNESNVYSRINSSLLLDFVNISNSIVIPGMVYEIIEKNSPFILSKVQYKKNKKIIEEEFNNLFKSIKYILVELTPPCDFAQDKKASKSRFVSGVMFDYIKTDNPRQYFSGDNFYTELFPFSIPNEESQKMIVLDFRYFNSMDEKELINKEKFICLFKVKDKLFADILQKLASHTSRLGLSIIH